MNDQDDHSEYGDDMNLPPNPKSRSPGISDSRGGRKSTAGSHAAGSRAAGTWNIRLLVKSLVILVVVAGGWYGLYLWQSSRLSSGLLQRAEAAEEAGDFKQQMVWLNRYLQAEPGDVSAFIKLGIAADESVSTAADFNIARQRLNGAIAKTGNSEELEAERSDLRKRLIKRLLRMGATWALEAERQLVLLDAPPEDPEALKWLAQAAINQGMERENRTGKSSYVGAKRSGE